MSKYQAYLLRLWRESETEPWRALLEDPATGARIAFGRPERLFAYLAEHFPGELPPAPVPPEPPASPKTE